MDGAVPFLEIVQDLTYAEQAHRDGDEVQPVGEGEAVEGETLGSGEHVASDDREQKTDNGGDQRFEASADADGGHEQDAEYGEDRVFGRAEAERELGNNRS